MFTKTFRMMLKQHLIIQTMNQKEHYQEEKIEKVIGLMKNEIGEKLITEFSEVISENIQLRNK